jgi:hypothetical protein
MWWTYDIGDAYDADEGTWCPSGSQLVPVEVAGSYIISLMVADLVSLGGS